MDKDQMVASVKAQIEAWTKEAHPYAWNCGPNGRLFGQQIDYAAFAEVSKADFDAAVAELKEFVTANIAGYSGREAKSLSGTDAGYNVWSFLIEPWGSGKTRKLNYHIRVGK